MVIYSINYSRNRLLWMPLFYKLPWPFYFFLINVSPLAGVHCKTSPIQKKKEKRKGTIYMELN